MSWAPCHRRLRALAFAAMTLLAFPASAADRPSIVLFLADDLRHDELAAMPNVGRLIGERGARFTEAYVQVSLCCPSRATLLTGRYTQNTGVRGNAGADGGFPAFWQAGNEERTVAAQLHEAGYRTALIGKYLNGYRLDLARHVPPGWDLWAATHGGSHQQYEYTLNENGRQVFYGDGPEAYATDVFRAKALGFIDQAVAADAPFFVYVSFLAPHEPAVAAPRHHGLFTDVRVPRLPSFEEGDVGDKPPFFRLPPLHPRQIAQLDAFHGQRLRSLQAIDEAVAGIVRRLEASGRLAETYLVFASDNGIRLGHHRMGIGKETAYADDSRIPLVVRGPGIAAGRTVTGLVTTADLAPTFAAWAGLAADPDVDGRPLLPLLTGTGQPTHWRRSVPVGYRPDPGVPLVASLERGPLRGLPVVHPPAYRGLRTPKLLFVDYATGERELYDTPTDPFELSNIAAATEPAVLQALSQRAEGLARCAGAACRALEDEPLPSIRAPRAQITPVRSPATTRATTR